MRGLLQFWFVSRAVVIVLAIGALTSIFANIFGDYSGIAFWTIFTGIVILALWLNIRSIIESKRDAIAIVSAARDGVDGPFLQWFDEQERWTNGDFIPLRMVPRLVAKAYNGMDRIALLFREGFGGIIQNDLVAVLGEDRAFMALRDLADFTQPSDVKFSLLGFIVGMKIGYDITKG